jgi:hypothetical protein
MTALLATSHTGWIVGYTIGGIVVVVVVALVVPILLLARTIGQQAGRINDGLGDAVTNTAALSELETTVASADAITAGLERGRTRLGG